MPELPEVECVRLGVESLQGSVVRSASTNYPKLWSETSLSIEVLAGQTLCSTSRRGKYLKLHFEEFDFLIHLGMSGVLLCGGVQRPHTHFYVQFQENKHFLHYSDPRKFGHLDLRPRGFAFARWESLGEDALSKKLDGTALFANFRKSASSVKQLLLDQKKVAGIGNIYASEILFDVGVSPMRLGNELTLAECEAMAKSAKKILRKSIKNRGTTFSDYRLTNGKGGAFQSFLKVFQKAGQSCPRCGGGLLKAVQQNRATFYCPNCQS